MLWNRDEELYINAIDKDTVAEIIETSKEVNGSAIFICGKNIRIQTMKSFLKQ